MYKIITRIITVLVQLLSYEASKHRAKVNHLDAKHANHLAAEQKAVANMKRQGRIYRDSLAVDSDIHERHADAASGLASRIKTILD